MAGKKLREKAVTLMILVVDKATMNRLTTSAKFVSALSHGMRIYGQTDSHTLFFIRIVLGIPEEIIRDLFAEKRRRKQ